MGNKFPNMTKADLVEAIQLADKQIIKTQKYSEDLLASRALPTDPLSKEKLLQSNGKLIEAKIEELKALALAK